MKIRLTETQYLKLIKEYSEDEYRHATIEEWEHMWNTLKKVDKSFGFYKNWFGFGGLEFFLDEDEGVLELPPQKLSSWRDDPTEAREILDKFVRRMESAFNESGLGLRLDVDPDYSMKVYKLN